MAAEVNDLRLVPQEAHLQIRRPHGRVADELEPVPCFAQGPLDLLRLRFQLEPGGIQRVG